MSVKLTWEKEYAIATTEGEVLYKEIRESADEFYGDPRFVEVQGLLIDFSAAINLQAGKDDLFAVGSMDSAASQSNPNIKVAIVVRNDDISRLLEWYRISAAKGNWAVEMFEDIDSAKAWLDK